MTTNKRYQTIDLFAAEFGPCAVISGIYSLSGSDAVNGGGGGGGNVTACGGVGCGWWQTRGVLASRSWVWALYPNTNGQFHNDGHTDTLSVTFDWLEMLIEYVCTRGRLFFSKCELR